MKRSYMHRNNCKPSAKTVSARRVRRAVLSIMRSQKLNYEEAVEVLENKGMKPTISSVTRTGGGSGYQPT